MIPQSFIDSLLDRLDIVEVVDARVKLKKAGKNYTACCPFHQEKTPSFTVTQDKQFYYCFGCGASGNAIGFIMDYDSLGFREAVEQLAHLSGMEVPSEDGPRSQQQIAREKERLTIYGLLEQATTYYKQQLKQHPAAKRAVEYLKGRGLSGEIARDFGIGYAPPGWDNLLKSLGSNVEQQRLLIESGMLINNDDNHKLYDRFRERVMFPIRDVRGRVIGFGGRVLNNDKPKYLNSPESPVFHKGEELYGLYEARQTSSSLPRLLVVEGYMDVVALAQFDLRFAVATLGTACREDHLRKAFKYTSEVVFCFDGDNAGRTAARRALEACLPIMEDGRQVKFLFLPEGEDPDTLVRQVGKDKFLSMLDDLTLPLEAFFFDVVSEKLDVRSMEGRARLSKLAAPLLHQLPKGVYRELMFNSLAKRTQLDVPTLMSLIEEVPVVSLAPREEEPQHVTVDDSAAPPEEYRETFTAPHPRPQQRKPASIKSSIELIPSHRLTLLLFHHPELAKEVESIDELENTNDEYLSLFTELVHLLRGRPHFTTGQIIGHVQGTHGIEGMRLLTSLIERSGLIRSAKQWEGYDPKQEFVDTLKKVVKSLDPNSPKAVLKRLRGKSLSDMTEEEKRLYREAVAQHPSKQTQH